MSKEKQETIAGIKKIKFDFDFEYSKGGDLDIGNTIILKAPSFLDGDFYNLMTSKVSKAVLAVLRESGAADASESEEPSNTSAESDDAGMPALMMMAMGMSDKNYSEYTTFLRKRITNNTVLAHIEGEEIGITDMLWVELEKAGGKSAIIRILSEYTDFFIEDFKEMAA